MFSVCRLFGKNMSPERELHRLSRRISWEYYQDIYLFYSSGLIQISQGTISSAVAVDQ